MLTENKTYKLDSMKGCFSLMNIQMTFVWWDQSSESSYRSGVEIVDVDWSVLEILHNEMNKNMVKKLVFLLLALQSLV